MQLACGTVCCSKETSFFADSRFIMSKFPFEAFVSVTFYLPFQLQVLNKSCLHEDVLVLSVVKRSVAVAHVCK
jgi:hypothetical protein